LRDFPFFNDLYLPSRLPLLFTPLLESSHVTDLDNGFTVRAALEVSDIWGYGHFERLAKNGVRLSLSVSKDKWFRALSTVVSYFQRRVQNRELLFENSDMPTKRLVVGGAVNLLTGPPTAERRRKHVFVGTCGTATDNARLGHQHSPCASWTLALVFSARAARQRLKAEFALGINVRRVCSGQRF
jgi:hypothetical protein